MQLYFIRHAQSANNKLYEETGSWNGRDSDPELTELGHEQAQRLAEHVACANGESLRRDLRESRRRSVSRISTPARWCAPWRRLHYLSAALDLPLVVWEDLHEVGGIFFIDDETGERIGQPGKTRSELAARFPQAQLPGDADRSGWWNRSH